MNMRKFLAILLFAAICCNLGAQEGFYTAIASAIATKSSSVSTETRTMAKSIMPTCSMTAMENP